MDFNSAQATLNSERTILQLPQPTLVVLCGVSGGGKSSFAARNFPPTWTVSSDQLRGLICDDQRSLESSADAFKLLFQLVETRLRFGRTTIVDSTALDRKTRKRLLEIARKYDFGTLMLLFDTPIEQCIARDATRINPPPVGPAVIKRQFRQFEHVRQNAYREGFDQLLLLSEAESTQLKVEIVPLPVEKPEERGPFDFIGDIHGCRLELEQLLAKLGYSQENGVYRHSEGRKVVFLGDLVNRGPDSVGVVKLVARMVQSNSALFVRGNHCQYVYGYLKKFAGKEYNRQREWLARLNPQEMAEFSQIMLNLVENSPPYLWLNNGKVIAVHAGLEQKMIGRLSPRIAQFCIYGEEIPSPSDPNKTERRDWAATYRGRPLVVYGHTPTKELTPQFRNNTVNLDQGCVYGRRLSALRYPEMQFVQVEAAQAYKS